MAQAAEPEIALPTGPLSVITESPTQPHERYGALQQPKTHDLYQQSRLGVLNRVKS